MIIVAHHCSLSSHAHFVADSREKIFEAIWEENNEQYFWELQQENMYLNNFHALM